MNPDHWSTEEKKVAHRAFEAALEREIAAVLAELKERAANAAVAQDIWAIEQFLTSKRREVDAKYDFRYSKLIMVFGRLMSDGWLSEADLIGLSEEKLSSIRFLATI
jgi:hypothetical protein